RLSDRAGVRGAVVQGRSTWLAADAPVIQRDARRGRGALRLDARLPHRDAGGVCLRARRGLGATGHWLNAQHGGDSCAELRGDAPVGPSPSEVAARDGWRALET